MAERESHKRYIWTPAELEEVDQGDLGPLEEGKYQETAERMRQLAEERAVVSPLMVLDIHFNEVGTSMTGLKEYVYPITEEEWDRFAQDAQTMCSQTPHAHMIDGDQFVAPI